MVDKPVFPVYTVSINNKESEDEMATELKSHAQGVSLTRFWGGENRGSCVQLTQKKQQLPATADKFFDSVQLTRAQAAAMAADLLDFAQGREEEDLGN